MVTDPLSWTLLLQVALGAAGLAGGIVAVRAALATLSPAARDARRKLQHKRALAERCGLRAVPDQPRFTGHVDGWPVVVEDGPTVVHPDRGLVEHWHVRLTCGPTAAPAPSRNGLPQINVEHGILTALLPVTDEQRLPELVAAMAAHASASTAVVPTAQASPLHKACTAQKLVRDGVLDVWTGALHGRAVRVERVSGTRLARLHLAVEVPLPRGLIVGGRSSGVVSGAPVPLPQRPEARTLAAGAHPSAVEPARALLHTPGLLAKLAPSLTCDQGSLLSDRAVVLVRPARVLAAAFTTPLQRAVTLAEHIEAAVEAPWRALGERHNLATGPDRSGRMPVLHGTFAQLRLTVSRLDKGTIEVLARPLPEARLAADLVICRGDLDGAVPTTNPILDGRVSVLTSTAPDALEPPLSALPAEALLPLLFERNATISSSGVALTLPQDTHHHTIVEVLDEVVAAVRALPRTTG